MDYEKLYHELASDVVNVYRDLAKVINNTNIKYHMELIADCKTATGQEAETLRKFANRNVFEYEAHPEKKEK